MKTPEAYEGSSFCASRLTVLGTGTMRVTYAVPSIEILLPLVGLAACWASDYPAAIAAKIMTTQKIIL